WSGEHPVDPVLEVDEQALSGYAASLVPEDRADPVDAEGVFAGAEQSWTAAEARKGQGVDPPTLLAQDTEPAQARESGEASPRVDGEVHDVAAGRRSGWRPVGPDESGQSLTIRVDEEGVREWVASRAEQDTVEPKDGIEQIDDEGEVVKVVSEKRDGVEITNAD